MRFWWLLTLAVLGVSSLAQGQVYVEKQTRHRFAQLNLGVDYQTNFGGQTSFLEADGSTSSTDLASLHRGRFLVGGTHFWGHADIYLALPIISPSQLTNQREITYTTGVETAFKVYPWRIEHQKIRPYLGVSLATFYYEQNNPQLGAEEGAELTHTGLPLMAGFTFNHKNHLLEVGALWNYANRQDYYFSPTATVSVVTPPLYANVSYRYMIETTLGAEKDWESGRTAELTSALASEKKLDGFFLGAGMSSTFWLGQSAYNAAVRPYMGTADISLFVDFTLGYYWHEPDLNVSLSYRGMGTGGRAFATQQGQRRRSLALEVTKYLGDYHGFAPFVGPALSWENLRFQEVHEEEFTWNYTRNRLGYGLTFGWDIRPTRMETFLLRTNLRWFPFLSLPLPDAEAVSFHGIEFNFIQLILFPNRIIDQARSK
ncbi:MAG: hypothetical protein AAFQ98_03580 [Bacteroidota bacterium]